MIGEIVLFAVNTGVGFILGFAIANMHTRAKQRVRRERRQRIIDLHRNVTDEICRWEIEHPQITPKASSNGQIIFKGGADKMSLDEFTCTLQEGVKAATDSVDRAFEGLADALKKLC